MNVLALEAVPLRRLGHRVQSWQRLRDQTRQAYTEGRALRRRALHQFSMAARRLAELMPWTSPARENARQPSDVLPHQAIST